jgi:hypothetical protein
MFNTDDFAFHFEEDDSTNPLLKEIYDSELEHSMRWSFDRMETIGIDKWFQIFPYHPDKKIRIVENMISWFADPAREEYEKCAYLKRGLDEVKKLKQEHKI